MKLTWLPLRLSVRHRSFTSPRENVALPAPITPILTAVPIAYAPVLDVMCFVRLEDSQNKMILGNAGVDLVRDV
jgi:hypothetical protein